MIEYLKAVESILNLHEVYPLRQRKYRDHVAILALKGFNFK